MYAYNCSIMIVNSSLTSFAGELGLKGLNFSFKSFTSFAGGSAGEERKK